MSAFSRICRSIDEAVRRRDDGAGARSGPRAHQDRPALGLCARRRPWGGSDPPAVAYVYAPDRKASQPIAHLAGFKGVLQVDGYAGYRALAERGDVSLAFCWSHVRRRFYELAVGDASPIASEALQRIAALYRIENDIRGRGPNERRAVRQARTRPLIADLEPWLREKLGLISQKSKLAEAIRYALSRWEGLTRFLDDGRIEIDSNTVERSIRPDRPQSQECALRRLRRRRRKLGRHRLADRDLHVWMASAVQGFCWLL